MMLTKTLGVALWTASLFVASTAFVAPLPVGCGHGRQHYVDTANPRCRKDAMTRLFAKVEVSSPSQEEAQDMGIREWPQQLKVGSWSEDVSEGQTLVRYVLDGKGSLTTDEGQRVSVNPGSLIEVTGPGSMSWETSSEMLVLTPGFEEGGKLAGVALALVVLCGALIAGVGS